MKKRALISLSLLSLAGCGQQILYKGLPEKEVNDMAAILLSNDIACTKIAGAENTWDLTVDKTQFSQGVQLLNEAGYPKDTFSSLGEAFKKSGLVSSPTEERIRFMHALSDELAETLTHIHGVVTARVHIVLPDNDPYTEKFTPSSASVFISYLPQINLDDCSREIRQLVTNSIEGLSYDKVNLSMFPASNPNDRLPFANAKKPNTKDIFGVKISIASVAPFFTLLGVFFVLGILSGVGVLFLLKHFKEQPTEAQPSTETKDNGDSQ